MHSVAGFISSLGWGPYSISLLPSLSHPTLAQLLLPLWLMALHKVG